MKLWLVFKYRESSIELEFQGVFDSEEMARAACVTPLHRMGPATLNRLLPEEGIEWEGVVYPMASDRYNYGRMAGQ